jgi:hypothetical protein
MAEIGVDRRLVVLAPREDGVLQLQEISAALGERRPAFASESLTLTSKDRRQTDLIRHFGIGIHGGLIGTGWHCWTTSAPRRPSFSG